MAQLNVPFLVSLGGLALAVSGALALIVIVRRPYRRSVRLGLGVAGGLLVLVGLAIVCVPYADEQGVLGLVASAVNTAIPVAGWTLVAFGATFILWGLLANRSRGRRRCPRCWYSMDGIEAAVCPECGHGAKQQRRLYRTRRNWRMVFGGVACIAAGYAGSLWLDIQRFGAGAVVPSPLVLAALEVRGWPRPASYFPPDLSAALLRRLQSTPRWVREFAYRRMARHWTIDYRPVWPAGVPIAVRPSDVRWYGVSMRGGKLEARLLDQPGGPSPWVALERDPTAFSSFDGLKWSDGMYEIGPLPVGRHEMKLEFRVVEATRDAESGADPPWSAVAKFPIEIVPSIDDVLTPVADTRLDQEIADGFVIEERATFGRGTSKGFGFALIPLARPEVAVAVKVEVLRDGRVVGTGRAWDSPAPAGSLRTAAQNNRPGLSMSGDRGVLQTFDLASGRWSVRITADPELALRDFERRQYWSGSIVLPAAK